MVYSIAKWTKEKNIRTATKEDIDFTTAYVYRFIFLLFFFIYSCGFIEFMRFAINFRNAMAQQPYIYA